MKASEFIKKFGWEYAIKIVKNQPEKNGQMFRHYDNKYSNEFTLKKAVSVVFLKRLVESWEIVNNRGGLVKCKQDIQNMRNCELKSHLSFHVEVVESCND